MIYVIWVAISCVQIAYVSSKRFIWSCGFIVNLSRQPKMPNSDKPATLSDLHMLENSFNTQIDALTKAFRLGITNNEELMQYVFQVMLPELQAHEQFIQPPTSPNQGN